MNDCIFVINRVESSSITFYLLILLIDNIVTSSHNYSTILQVYKLISFYRGFAPENWFVIDRIYYASCVSFQLKALLFLKSRDFNLSLKNDLVEVFNFIILLTFLL